MFTQWTISNFKSIRKPITLNLAPLTIFAGANSSGKSTVIQSLLMVAQSFMSVVDEEALVLNGQLIRLGPFEDVLHHGSADQPLKVGFIWQPINDSLPRPRITEIKVRATITRQKRLRLNGKGDSRSYPRLTNSEIDLVYETVPEKKKVHHLDINAFERGPLTGSFLRLNPAMLEQIEAGLYDYNILTKEQLLLNPKLESIQGVALTNIIPSRLLIGIDARYREFIDDTDWLINLLDQLMTPGQKPEHPLNMRPLSPLLHEVFHLVRPDSDQKSSAILADLRSEIRHSRPGTLSRVHLLRRLSHERYSPTILRSLRDSLVWARSAYLAQSSSDLRSNRDDDILFEERLLPTEIALGLEQLRQVMTQQIYYLGPLRDDPRVIYNIPPLSKRRTVGLKGEYTAAMLNEYYRQSVEYPIPPDTGEFNGVYRSKKGALMDGLMIWLQRMGLIDGLDTEETPKVGYRLTVTSPGLNKPLDLTNVGVGVSQILPTLVLALLTPPGSVLIFEQPELHLHPKVQSVLADFFMGMASLGKQCVIETHSEHLINRLRRRIVEAERDSLLRLLKIYFVEKEGSVSQFREVESNEFGAILDWPKGFFDEAETEASILLKSQIEKRRLAREQRNTRKEAK